jgi:hypothetical protein
MKKKLLFLLVMLNLFQHHNANAQAPPWLWAKSAGDQGNENGYGVAVDGNGNVFVTGNFTSTSLTFGSTTLNNAGNTDFFLVKYDNSGNVLWAKSAGGTSYEGGLCIAVDAGGNVLVGGYLQSASITLGSVTLNNSAGTSSDFFTVKYDNSGNVLWAKSAGGTGLELMNGIAVDAGGNVFVTGTFYSPSFTFGSTTLINGGSAIGDVFVAKYDNSGNPAWAKSAGGVEFDVARRITTDAGGNVFVTGMFASSSITFGSVTLNSSVPGFDIFIVKYDNNGNALWAKRPGIAVSYGIATDAGGNAYITGNFSNPSLIVGSDTLISAGSEDCFVIKYDSSGNAVWAERAGGNGTDVGNDIACDAAGNVFVTGSFRGLSFTFGITTLTNAGTAGTFDMFVFKYDSSGNPLWAKSVGATGEENGNSIAIDASTNAYVTGGFGSASVAFGSTTLNNAIGGSVDIYTAKLEGIVGIEENNFSASIHVFPNPFSAELIITDKTNSPSEIFLYDVTGRKIFSRTFSHSVAINTEQLVEGIYFYYAKNGNEIISSGKVIKQ